MKHPGALALALVWLAAGLVLGEHRPAAAHAAHRFAAGASVRGYYVQHPKPPSAAWFLFLLFSGNAQVLRQRNTASRQPPKLFDSQQTFAFPGARHHDPNTLSPPPPPVCIPLQACHQVHNAQMMRSVTAWSPSALNRPMTMRHSLGVRGRKSKSESC